jgi:hypothetical protein
MEVLISRPATNGIGPQFFRVKETCGWDVNLKLSQLTPTGSLVHANSADDENNHRRPSVDDMILMAGEGCQAPSSDPRPDGAAKL